jgi:hypothetical protein
VKFYRPFLAKISYCQKLGGSGPKSSWPTTLLFMFEIFRIIHKKFELLKKSLIDHMLLFVSSQLKGVNNSGNDVFCVAFFYFHSLLFF